MNRPRTGYKSYKSAINGVSKYVQDHFSNCIEKTSSPPTFFKRLNLLMISFLKENNFEFKNGGSYSVMDYNANKVQDNWKEFKEWLKNHNAGE